MDAQPQSPRPQSLVSPSQLVAIGLVAASIGWAMWLMRDRPRHEEVELLSGSVLPSSELAIMEAAFDRAQLTDYRTEGGRVWVPRARQSAYMRALVDAEALPREFGGSLRRALENNSPWQSKAVQSEILRVATQDELALVICSMPGIERAAVLYDVDEDSAGGLRGTRVKTASVSVRTQPDTDLDRGRVEAIRVLVAASIAGLTPDRVAVTDLRSGRVHAGPLDAGDAVAAVDPALARTIAHERRLADKIRQAIAFVKGASVDVAVEFGPAPAPEPAPPAPDPETEGPPPQPPAAANAPAEIAIATPPAPATPPPPAPPAADVPVKVHVAIAVPETALEAATASAPRQLDRLRDHVLELVPMTPDPANRRVVITTYAVAAPPRREGPAAPPAAPVAAVAAPVRQPSPPAEAAAGQAAAPDVTASLLQLLRALGVPVVDDTIPRQVWIAATSVCVGLLAAWMWWAGSRRHAGGAMAASQPAIDWSRQRPVGRDQEPLDRVAA